MMLCTRYTALGHACAAAHMPLSCIAMPAAPYEAVLRLLDLQQRFRLMDKVLLCLHRSGQ